MMRQVTLIEQPTPKPKEIKGVVNCPGCSHTVPATSFCIHCTEPLTGYARRLQRMQETEQ